MERMDAPDDTQAVARAREALLALIGEIDGLDLLADVTDEELAFGKKRRRVAAALTLERSAALAPQLAFWWSSGGIEYYLTYDQRMNTQTLEDMRRCAAAYIAAKPKSIGVLGPPAVVDSLAAWLRGGGRP